MGKIVYLNGEWLPSDKATVSVEDRGFLFADGVYEVVCCFNGIPFEIEPHLARLRNSLEGIRLDPGFDVDSFESITRELMRRNDMPNMLGYWQITRGAAPRDHAFPSNVQPTVVAIPYEIKAFNRQTMIQQFTAGTVNDDRWHRCDIKSISLLPNVLATDTALNAGYDAAILLRDDIVTEAPAKTIWMVRGGGVTCHPLGNHILPSVTRAIALEICEELEIPVVQTSVSRDELYQMDEVMSLSTTTPIAAITEVDGHVIGTGRVGPITERLFNAYKHRVVTVCGG